MDDDEIDPSDLVKEAKEYELCFGHPPRYE